MVQINKREADAVRKAFPWAHIKRTVHKYYVEESARIMAFLGRKLTRRFANAE